MAGPVVASVARVSPVESTDVELCAIWGCVIRATGLLDRVVSVAALWYKGLATLHPGIAQNLVENLCLVVIMCVRRCAMVGLVGCAQERC